MADNDPDIAVNALGWIAALLNDPASAEIVEITREVAPGALGNTAFICQVEAWTIILNMTPTLNVTGTSYTTSTSTTAGYTMQVLGPDGQTVVRWNRDVRPAYEAAQRRWLQGIDGPRADLKALMARTMPVRRAAPDRAID